MGPGTRWTKRYSRRRLLGGLAVVALLALALLLPRGYAAFEEGKSPAPEAFRGASARSPAEPAAPANRHKQKVNEPYKAIPPPKGAEPPSRDALARKVLGLESVPLTWRTSGDGSRLIPRSVPVGRTLHAGEKDPSGGPLEDHRLVMYYGTPLSDQMGILGEYPPKEMMRRLEKQARAYSKADPKHPAIPTIELIASTAQRDPGPDGLYVSRLDPKVIRRYADLAKRNGALLMLDVQLGRDTVMDEVRALEPFLKLPYVELAIDTEYHVGPGEVPGQDLGSVDGSEVQQAVRYLDRLVEQKHLPDKVVLVHQFQAGVVTNVGLVKPTKHVEVVLNADGFGVPKDKLAKYRLLVRNQPVQYGGFKLFYGQDRPLLTPEEVVRMDPAPAVVNYQ